MPSLDPAFDKKLREHGFGTHADRWAKRKSHVTPRWLRERLLEVEAGDLDMLGILGIDASECAPLVEALDDFERSPFVDIADLRALASRLSDSPEWVETMSKSKAASKDREFANLSGMLAENDIIGTYWHLDDFVEMLVKIPAINSLSTALEMRGGLTEAEMCRKKVVDALEAMKARLGPHFNAEMETNLAVAYDGLARIMETRGHEIEAEVYRRKSIDQWQDIRGRVGTAFAPEMETYLAVVYDGLATSLEKQGRLEDAEECRKESVAAFERLRDRVGIEATTEMDIYLAETYLAESYDELAENLEMQGKIEDAKIFGERADLSWGRSVEIEERA